MMIYKRKPIDVVLRRRHLRRNLRCLVGQCLEIRGEPTDVDLGWDHRDRPSHRLRLLQKPEKANFRHHHLEPNESERTGQRGLADRVQNLIHHGKLKVL